MASKQISDSWERGSPYESYVGRWSHKVAPRFLECLHMPDALRWLDVGCGTGALCAAIADAWAPSSLIGIDPSEGFLKSAGANLGGRAVLHLGSAASIPLPEDGRARLRERIRQHLPCEPDGSIRRMARAWTFRGALPG